MTVTQVVATQHRYASFILAARRLSQFRVSFGAGGASNDHYELDLG
jgi:hypothetical protein